MLDGDQDRIRMVYSLVFSLPGTPVLFYGEEIGMAENLEIEGRLERPLADAVVARAPRRLLDRARGREARAGRSARRRQRRRAAPRIPTRC